MSNILIEMSSDEALVLFELLSKNEDKSTFSLSDSAEQIAVWRLQTALEKKLVEPFKNNYDELLKEAKARLESEE